MQQQNKRLTKPTGRPVKVSKLDKVQRYKVQVDMDKVLKEEKEKEDKRKKNYGLGKKTLNIEFEKNKQYLLKIKGRGSLIRKFKGELVQATHNHITFKNKNGIRESFLRNDFLRNEIQVEVA